MNRPIIEMKLLHPDAVVPVGATDGSAGYDLFIPEKWFREGWSRLILHPGETLAIPLDIAVNIVDKGIAMVLLPRSGYGKEGLVLANTVGLIDSDYQGNVTAVLYNRGENSIDLLKDKAFAQAIFVPVIHPVFHIVGEFSTKTKRGEGGFGHTDRAREQLDC